MESIEETRFKFEKCTGFHRGKVRDLYFFKDILLVISTDRISAFDTILPFKIPYKGHILNQIATFFLERSKYILPNWFIEMPYPNITIGKRCEPFKIEMIIRRYLVGHAWRQYRMGKRQICGIILPEGLKENDCLPEPIITPTTKFSQKKDRDISKEEILSRKLINENEYAQLEKYTYQLFEEGTEYARSRGLILADTKYEFGKYKGKIYLIDEIHTPDSSRYFYQREYSKRHIKKEKLKQLSKEYVREWLTENNFQKKKNQIFSNNTTTNQINRIFQRYMELYETLIGKSFIKTSSPNSLKSIQSKIMPYLTV